MLSIYLQESEGFPPLPDPDEPELLPDPEDPEPRPPLKPPLPLPPSHFQNRKYIKGKNIECSQIRAELILIIEWLHAQVNSIF